MAGKEFRFIHFCKYSALFQINDYSYDLKVTRYNSPALDLGYYFFTSVKPDVRQKHLREMLELYKETVNSVTEEFGHPINLTYEVGSIKFRKSNCLALQ